MELDHHEEATLPHGKQRRTVRVPVSAAVLRWALNRSPIPEDTLSERFPKLPEWIGGSGQPTLLQLEQFARATCTPFGYMFLSEPPAERLPIPHFRTRREGLPEWPSADLLETVQTMERRQAWMREYLEEEGEETLAFVGSAYVDDDPAHTAAQIRSILNLDEKWARRQPNWSAALKELQRRAEQAGIMVVASGVVGNNTHRQLEPTEFRGFVLVDQYAPLVFINAADGKAAQMFTLAHELAHVWLGASAAFDLRELLPADHPVERACNRVAAELLVAASELRELWTEIRSETQPFQAIARHFKVSEIVAARRALDLGLVSRDCFLEFYSSYQQQERERRQPGEGGDFYTVQSMRLGRRFSEAVIRATREGRILYHEAYRLTGLYGRSFEAYARHIEAGTSR